MSTDIQQQTLLLSGPVVPESIPDWLAGQQREAWGEFGKLSMPTRTDERWRFSTINRLSLEDFALPGAASKTPPALPTIDGAAGIMQFLNDRTLRSDTLPAELLERGVIWLPISVALEKHSHMLSEYFMAQFTGLGGDKFALLHKAFVREGAFLYVPDNVEIEGPLVHHYGVEGDGASTFPHTLLITGANTKVTVLDIYHGAGGKTLACGVNDLFVGDGSNVTYVSCQNWAPDSLSFHFNSTHVGRDATVRALGVHLGGRYNRSESVSHLNGKGGRSEMLAVTLASGTQEFDQRTLQDHQQPGCASDLLYKNALDDQARTIFSGLIKVEPGAHQTDAYQKVRNLMLSDEAESNSMPGLEILADDVRCTHGATGGEIDADELFYLKTRGLTEAVARRLIVGGFLEEVFGRIDEPGIAPVLSAMISSKLFGRA